MTAKLYSFPLNEQDRLRHNRHVSILLEVLDKCDPEQAAFIRAQEKKRIEASFMPRNIESHKIPNSPEEARDFVNRHLEKVEERWAQQVGLPKNYKETPKELVWPMQNRWQLIGNVLAAGWFISAVSTLVYLAHEGFKL